MAAGKEPEFFNDENHWQRGVDWYRGQFAAAGDAVVAGEASVRYATSRPASRRVPERMATVLPDAKLVYVVRHPVDRMISQWRHNRDRYAETASLEEALEHVALPRRELLRDPARPVPGALPARPGPPGGERAASRRPRRRAATPLRVPRGRSRGRIDDVDRELNRADGPEDPASVHGPGDATPIVPGRSTGSSDVVPPRGCGGRSGSSPARATTDETCSAGDCTSGSRRSSPTRSGDCAPTSPGRSTAGASGEPEPRPRSAWGAYGFHLDPAPSARWLVPAPSDWRTVSVASVAGPVSSVVSADVSLSSRWPAGADRHRCRVAARPRHRGPDGDVPRRGPGGPGVRPPGTGRDRRDHLADRGDAPPCMRVASCSTAGSGGCVGRPRGGQDDAARRAGRRRVSASSPTTCWSSTESDVYAGPRCLDLREAPADAVPTTRVRDGVRHRVTLGSGAGPAAVGRLGLARLGRGAALSSRCRAGERLRLLAPAASWLIGEQDPEQLLDLAALPAWRLVRPRLPRGSGLPVPRRCWARWAAPASPPGH